MRVERPDLFDQVLANPLPVGIIPRHDAALIIIDDPYRSAPFVATETSYEAAKAIEPSRARLKERVFAIIDTDGPVTDEYIAMATGLSPNTARPRRIELERAGRIEKAGHQLTSAGRKAVAWRVVTED